MADKKIMEQYTDTIRALLARAEKLASGDSEGARNCAESAAALLAEADGVGKLTQSGF
jgi:hypothetical protein